MTKVTRDALRVYAAACPHVGLDTLMRDIKARTREGASESEIVGEAVEAIRQREREAHILMIESRHAFVEATTG